MIGSEAAVDLEHGSEVVLFLVLLEPLKFGLETILDAGPTEILDVHVVGGLVFVGGGIRAGKDRGDANADGAVDALIAGGDGGKAGVNGGVWAVALVANDESHGVRRQVASVYRGDDVFLEADGLKVAEGIGMLDGVGPGIGVGQKDRDGFLRIDFNVNVAAIGSGVIGAAGMIVRGIETQGFVVGGLPVKNFIGLGVREDGKRAERGESQECEFAGFHHSSIAA